MTLPNSRPAPRGAHPLTATTTGTVDPVRDEQAPQAEPPPVPLGWDAFEVWRTRVRDARRDVTPRRAR